MIIVAAANILMWSADKAGPVPEPPPAPVPKPAQSLHSQISVGREKRLAVVMRGAKERIDSGKIDSDKKLNKWVSRAKDVAEEQSFQKFHAEMNALRREDGKFNKQGYSKFFGKYEKEFGGKK